MFDSVWDGFYVFVILILRQFLMTLFVFWSPLCVTRESTTMSLTNGQSVSKETWDSHNKMMLEPLATSDSEVCVQWSLKMKAVFTPFLSWDLF